MVPVLVGLHMSSVASGTLSLSIPMQAGGGSRVLRGHVDVSASRHEAHPNYPKEIVPHRKGA